MYLPEFSYCKCKRHNDIQNMIHHWGIIVERSGYFAHCWSEPFLKNLLAKTKLYNANEKSTVLWDVM